jgi:type I restriction enzyme S subunit
VDELDSDVEVAIARAGRLRQVILSNAFLGRLVHQERNDEPASILLDRIRAERQSAQASTKQKPGRKRKLGLAEPDAPVSPSPARG